MNFDCKKVFFPNIQYFCCVKHLVPLSNYARETNLLCLFFDNLTESVREITDCLALVNYSNNIIASEVLSEIIKIFNDCFI